jgi:hypothetical protein
MTRPTQANYVPRWAVGILAIAMVLAILFFLASLVVIYVGDEYASPPWSAESVPAPKAY